MTTPNSTAARPVTAAVQNEIRILGDLTEHQVTTAAWRKHLPKKIDKANRQKRALWPWRLEVLIKELRSTMEELRSPSSDAANSDLVRFLMEDE